MKCGAEMQEASIELKIEIVCNYLLSKNNLEQKNFFKVLESVREDHSQEMIDASIPLTQENINRLATITILLSLEGV